MKSPGFAERLSITKLLTAVLSLLLVIFVSSCTQQEQRQTRDLPSDQNITTAIQTQMVESGEIDTTGITVESEEGIVTISGDVDNLLAKEKATNIAESTFGVLSVVNNLKITTDRPDKALKQDVNTAISTDPVTEDWKISTDVENGLVTLTGIVDSWREKQLVGNIVRGVKGVKEITNNLIINYSADRTDEEIKTEVKRTLTMDSRIDDNMVEVSVENGEVSLSGSVGSAFEKKLASELAHITGVEKVVADDLEVRPEYDSRMFRNDKIETLTESEIRMAIEKALAYDPRVPEDSIRVGVDGSTAILTGTVRNLSSKIAAGNDARHTAGINTVQNDINVARKVVVRPDIATTDEAITERIRNSITRDPYVENIDIEIGVDKGIAVLSGVVDSEFEKQQAGQVASAVKGVVAVHNNLEIRKQQNI